MLLVCDKVLTCDICRKVNNWCKLMQLPWTFLCTKQCTEPLNPVKYMYTSQDVDLFVQIKLLMHYFTNWVNIGEKDIVDKSFLYVKCDGTTQYLNDTKNEREQPLQNSFLKCILVSLSTQILDRHPMTQVLFFKGFQFAIFADVQW